MYQYFFKRLLDICISSIALLFLSPALLLIVLLIKIDSTGPVLFKQIRLGKDNKTFTVYKFRTMTDKDRVVDRVIYKGDPDVTRLGEVLRRFKIDEIPQLFNVLLGDMSLIGPRPCMPEMLEQFDDNGKYRTKVLPGLTGLAQVNGNIYLDWKDRWQYDRRYVENISFFLDCIIILKTLKILLKGEDKFIKKPTIE